jgi:DNA-binding SARP family transcriptional activator
VEIGILGPLAVTGDEGQPLTVSGARVRAMLALMALEPGVPLAAERLVDGLWGADPPASTGNALATLAKRLRASLGAADVIQARSPGYLLLVPPDAVDAIRFGQLAAAGRRALRAGEAGAAADALSLWRGPALAGVAAPFAAAAAAPAAARAADRARDAGPGRRRTADRGPGPVRADPGPAGG